MQGYCLVTINRLSDGSPRYRNDIFKFNPKHRAAAQPKNRVVPAGKALMSRFIEKKSKSPAREAQFSHAMSLSMATQEISPNCFSSHFNLPSESWV